MCALGGSAAKQPTTNHISLAVGIYQALSSHRRQGSRQQLSNGGQLRVLAIGWLISFPRITIFFSLLTTPPVELFGGVLVPSTIWINCINPSVEEDFFTGQLFQIVCCCYCYRSHRPEDLVNCYHYAIMQLLLCVLLFSQWSKYACIYHYCMPRACNARCWPIIAPTTTTFEWSLLQSPSLLKQQYNW